MASDSAKPKTQNNWLFYGPLLLLSTIFVIAGMLVAYYIVQDQFGYHGGKSGVFWIAGGLLGYYVTHPLWMLYRRYYPKAKE